MTRTYAYYPGCSSESTARDMDASTREVACALGLDFQEIEGWTCCGATAAHQTDHVLATSLATANLVRARDMQAEMIVNCAACYNRMKAANNDVTSDPSLRNAVADAVGRDYDGGVRVRHVLEVLLDDVGVTGIRERLTKSLDGLNVASYYGCLLVRPTGITGFDDPENPTSLDRLVTAMGGIAIEWPHKVECCGAGLSLVRTDVVVGLADGIIGMAKDSGADCIALTCPMCQSNLDLRQADIAKSTGRRYDMPIVYITQLLGLCLGIAPRKLGLEKPMVAVNRIIDAVK